MRKIRAHFISAMLLVVYVSSPVNGQAENPLAPQPVQSARVKFVGKIVSAGTDLTVIANEHGFAADAMTIEEFKRLNPGKIEGTKVITDTTLFSPVVNRTSDVDRPQSTLLKLNTNNFGRLVFTTGNERTQATLAKASNSRIDAYVNPEVKNAHLLAVQSTGRALAALEKYQTTLGAQELAQISMRLEAIAYLSDTSSSPEHKIDESAVTFANETSTYFASLTRSQESTRSSESMERHVTVAYKRNGQDIPGFRVYVIPEGFYSVASNLSDRLLMDALRSFTFPNLTSPTTGLLSFGKWAIWIDSDYEYEKAVKALRTGKIKSTPLEIRLASPKTILLQISAP